jgi:hypothetical protein
VQTDSDVSWYEVERAEGCRRPDGKLDGPTVEFIGSTRLRGRYVAGHRVGTWTQVDSKSGAVVGAFTLDDTGTGWEILHDGLGHSIRGTVVMGRREGVWSIQDADGKVVAIEVWSRGRRVRQTGEVPWQRALLDGREACAVDGGAPPENNGCPDRGQ